MVVIRPSSEPFKEIARREVRCFVTKHEPGELILGVGLHYDKKKKALTSTFDYISKVAFEDLNIRTDSNNRPIEFWLPLAIDVDHYVKASGDIRRRLHALDTEVHNRGMVPQPQGGLQQDPIKHLFAMANMLVVDLVEAYDTADISPVLSASYTDMFRPTSSLQRASERAIAGYCSIIHLITSYAIEHPKVKEEACRRIRAFNTSPAARRKSVVPDLGQLLVQLCLVDDISWSDVRAAVVREQFTRSVLWQLEPAPKGRGLPGLAYLEEDPICEWRLAETFKAHRTGLRLCLFQIFFMEKLAKTEGSSLLNLRDDFNNRRGLAPPGLTTELLERIKVIYKIDNLIDFAKEAGRVTT